jgi:hypothetical protein
MGNGLHRAILRHFPEAVVDGKEGKVGGIPHPALPVDPGSGKGEIDIVGL